MERTDFENDILNINGFNFNAFNPDILAAILFVYRNHMMDYPDFATLIERELGIKIPIDLNNRKERSSFFQEIAQCIEITLNEIPDSSNFLTAMFSFYIYSKDVQVEGTTLLVGSFTNLTAQSFLKLSKKLKPNNTPLIIDPYVRRVAEETGRNYALANGSGIPLQSESVSIIYADKLMEHVYRFTEDNCREILSEMMRALKPGGRIVLVEFSEMNQMIESNFNSLNTDSQYQISKELHYTYNNYQDMFKRMNELESTGKINLRQDFISGNLDSHTEAGIIVIERNS